MGHVEARCKGCKKAALYETPYGTMVCTRCGVEHPGFLGVTATVSSSYRVPLLPGCNYTRVKRFRKYLQRASMQQSAASVPQETWEYLLARQRERPFLGPQDIIMGLKRAGSAVKRKCYDSLPLLVKTLCPHIRVPTINESDKYKAYTAFRQLDEAWEADRPFVSYLYALEFILTHIGRADVLPYINKIKCRKRRHAYRECLRDIFSSKRFRSTACSPASSSSPSEGPASCYRLAGAL